MSSLTEDKVNKVLKTIIELELSSKPTTLEDDYKLLNERNMQKIVPKNQASKGFNKRPNGFDTASESSVSVASSNIRVEDDIVINSILFRIEKKKLLVESLKLS
jgi:hypothetical protein